MTPRSHGSPPGSRSSSARRGARTPGSPRARHAPEQRRPARQRARLRGHGEGQAPAGAPPRRRFRPGRRARIAAIVVGACALCGAAYAAALDTSMFALRTLDIRGGTPGVDAQVRAALAPEMGESLLRVSGAAVDRAAASLSDVVSLRFVRSFPHTLRVEVTPERPVLLIRRGTVGFVVSARGRVMAESRRPLASKLPRMWVPRGTPLAAGETLGRANGLLAAAAAAALGPRTIPGGVRFITEAPGEITLVTPGRFQVRLGDNSDLSLKLAIATKIMGYLGANVGPNGYLDVSVPERPVVGINSQVGSRA